MKEVTPDNPDGMDHNFTPGNEEYFRSRRLPGLAVDADNSRSWRAVLASSRSAVRSLHFGHPFWKDLQQTPAAFTDFTKMLLKAGRYILKGG